MRVQEALTIEEIQRRFPDEWVLIEVLEEDDLGRPLRGYVTAHSADRDRIYAIQTEFTGDYAVCYTGALPRKGFAIAF